MGKKKTHSETEYLRGLVRELKSEVRHLKKEVGKAGKKMKGYDQFVSEYEEDVTEEKTVPTTSVYRCPSCSSKIDIVEIGNRELHMCDNCNYRKTFKKK